MLTDFLLKQKKILNKSTNSDLPLGIKKICCRYRIYTQGFTET